MSNRIRKVNIKDYFSPYFIQTWRYEDDVELSVEYCNPEQFVVSERIDLICKLFYIECREKKFDLSFARELYTEHLRAFSEGTFTEPGNEEKNSIEQYFDTFDRLIDDIREKGFDAGKSVIPVSDNGVILDGSHRVAIAVYYNIELPIVRIHGIEQCFDTAFFQKNGLKRIYLDFMIDRYIRRKEQTYVVCLWPAGYDLEKNKSAEDIIAKSANIVYRKEIKFNYSGIKQLVTQVYYHQRWTGNIDNGYSGVEGKAKPCFAKNKITTIYVIEDISQPDIIELKTKIRDIYQLENHSIHITDTKDEAIEAAELLFNENSIHLANHGDPSVYWDTVKAFILQEPHEDRVSNITPTLYGICDGDVNAYSKDEDLVNDPLKYLYYFGKKALALSEVRSGDKAINAKFVKLLKQNRLGTIQEEYIPPKEPKKSLRERMTGSIEKNSFGVRALNKYRNIKYADKPVEQKNIEDIGAVFENLPSDCTYLIMRNWEGFYDDIIIEGHNDIDVLCANTKSRDQLVSAFSAKDLSGNGFHYSFMHKGVEVTLDTRIVGDGYYDIKWQREMLENRARNPLGFYVMTDEDYFYSLAYHAIYQKKDGLSDEYRARLCEMKPEYSVLDQDGFIRVVHDYMLQHGYFYTHTVDDSVIRCFDRVPDRSYVRILSRFNEIPNE